MEPLIIKLGGVLLDNEKALTRFFTALQEYRTSHSRPLVIVHGGGCLVDSLMKKLQLPVVKKQGLRVTPPIKLTLLLARWQEVPIKHCCHGPHALV